MDTIQFVTPTADRTSTFQRRKSIRESSRLDISKIFSLTFLAMNNNNAVSLALFILVTILDKAVLITITVLLLLNQQDGIPANESQIGYFISGELTMIHLYVIIGSICAIQIFSILCFLLLANRMKTLEQCHQKSNIARILSFLETLKQDLCPNLLMFGSITTLMHTCSEIEEQSHQALIAMTLITLFLQLFSVLYSNKISNLCIPSPEVPQSKIKSNINELIRYGFAIVVCMNYGLHLFFENSIESNKTIVYLIVLSCAILHSVHTILMPTYFDKKLEVLNLVAAATVTCGSFLMFFNHLAVLSTSSNTWYYCLIMLVFYIPFHLFMRRVWTQQLESKVFSNDVSQKWLIQFAISGVIEQILKLQILNMESLQSQATLILAQIQLHSFSCSDHKCRCRHLDAIQWLILKAQKNQSPVIELDQCDIEIVNAANEIPLIKESSTHKSPYIFGQCQARMVYQQQSKLDTLGNQSPLDKSVKINTQILLLVFVTNYLKDYMELASSKYPDNVQVHLFNAFYALICQRNIYKCISIINNYYPKDKSFAEKANCKMVHLYLMNLCQEYIKTQDKYESGYQLESMGLVQDQQSPLVSEYDLDFNPESFITINKLQSLFDSCIHNFSIASADFWQLQQAETYKIIRVQEASQKVANYICQSQDLFQTLDQKSKQKDYKLYYQFAAIHKYLLNDKEAHDLYVAKAKSIINIAKLSYKNLSKQLQCERDVGLIIASASPDSAGQLIFCNNYLTNGLGYTAQDLKYASVETLQPSLIRQYHLNFLRNNTTNASQFLNHRLSLFMKKKNGYICPVDMMIKYHYSLEMGPIYIGKVQFKQSITLGQQTLPLHQLMIFLCGDDNQRIYDVSENCEDILGLTQEIINENDYSPVGNQLTIADVCSITDHQKEVSFETDVELNLDCISNLNTQLQKDRTQNIVNTSCFVFNESLFDNLLKLRIVMIKIQQGVQTRHLVNFSSQDLLSPRNNQKEDCEDLGSYGNQTFSMTGSSQVSISIDDSNNIQNLLKNSSFSMRKKIPRIQRVVLQLIFFVFLLMCIISSIGLYLSQKIQSNLSIQIETVYQSFERMSQTTKARSSLRIILNIANGIIPTYSQLLGADRFDLYSGLLQRSSEALLDVQQYFDNTATEWYSDFQEKVGEKLQLVFMNQDGSLSYDNQTLTIAVNMYVSKIQEVLKMNVTSLKGELYFLNINDTPVGYNPTQNERTLYFLVINSMNSIRTASMDQIDMYMDQMQERANGYRLWSILISTISIVSILGVGLSLIPMIKKIVQRQLQALSFFVELPTEAINSQLQLCQEFLNEQERKEEFNKQRHKKIGKKRTMKLQKVMEVSNDLEASKQQEVENNHAEENIHFSLYEGNISIMYNSYLVNSSTDDLRQEPSYKQSKGNISSTQLDHNDPQSHNTLVQNQSMITEAKQKPHDKDEDNDDSTQDMQSKLDSINRAKKRVLNSTVVRCMLLIACFSCYFLGSFLLSNVTFSSIPKVLDSLHMLYYKVVCTQMLISDVRDSVLMNTTINITRRGQTYDAVDYVSDKCRDYQQQYIHFRKDIPRAFKSLAQEIADIEEGKLCNYIYPDDADKIAICNSYQKGIFTNGLSAFVAYTNSLLKLTSDNFFLTNRTASDIKQYSQYANTSRIVDLNLIVLENFNFQFKQLATQASRQYFVANSQQYMYLYVCFMVFLVLIIVFLRVKYTSKIQDYLWKTNLLLKILPIDKLETQKQQEVKKFLKTN